MNPAVQLSNQDLVQLLSQHLEQRVEKDKFSGAVLLAKDGEVLFKHAYGIANRRYDVPNQVDTKFNLGSMNKMFTGVAIAQLAEKGKLDFTDLVGAHLPDFAHKDIAGKVTIHHLLTHTGGLGSYFNREFMMASKDRFHSIDDFIPLMIDEPLAFEPGERWQYSNSGFLLLGKLIEIITGQSYYDYVLENIHMPAGMENTDCYEMDDDSVKNLAMGYTRMFSQRRKRVNNIFMHSYKGGPAGGGFSTVEDLFKFDQALRQHRLLSPASTGLVLSGKVNVGEDGDSRYAYGFEDTRYDGMRVVGHGGGFPGINSRLDMYPELGYSLAVMSNYDPRAAEGIASYVRKLVGSIPMVEPVQLRDDAILPILGEYILEEGPFPDLVLHIVKEQEEIIARFPPGFGMFEIVPLSENEYCDEETTDRRLFFQRDEQGNVQSLRTKDRREVMLFKKVG